jgi:4-hydroxybenzoate polyprenyltransferase
VGNDFHPISQSLLRFLIHLRLKFIAILVPIFLWGAFVAEGRLDTSFWQAFVLFHLCLYGGVNALNTYYDRDEGPIGGLKCPPPVDASLFYLAWGIQILGFGVSFVLPAGFWLIYLAAMLMSVAYSHPSIRLKGHPLGSAFIVAIGQGWLTYWAGWIAGGIDAVSVFALKGVLGGVGITIITVGLYPLTQIYQLESDRARGDRTLTIWLGSRNAFRFALSCVILAAACIGTVLWRYVQPLEAVVLLAYFAGLWGFIFRWGRAFPSMNQMQNYKRVMRLYLINSSCFVVYLTLHFLGIL